MDKILYYVIAIFLIISAVVFSAVAIKSGLILCGVVLPSFGDEKFIKEPLKEILQYTADEE